MIVARVREPDGVECQTHRLASQEGQWDNRLGPVGSERYGAMGRDLPLYAETRVSEEFYTEWVMSLSPSAVRAGCVECGRNTN